MSDLLPCPHCNGAPRLARTGGDDERNGYSVLVTIRCPECDATVSCISKSDPGGWSNEHPAAQEARAIAAWNRRVKPKPVAVVVRLPAPNTDAPLSPEIRAMTYGFNNALGACADAIRAAGCVVEGQPAEPSAGWDSPGPTP
jgi:hypothetical protein